jgi:hypothetical protein
MLASSDIAFKEWAVVVEALGSGEQILVLRKGGIRERHGTFQVEHHEFWLFPTQYHETEHAIIPSKRPLLHDLQARTDEEFVDIEFYAIAENVVTISDASLLRRLQGRHIWTEKVLQERFEFGREPGLQALLTRIYRLPSPQRFVLRESYAGCKSWVQLEHSIRTAELRPVLTDAGFSAQQERILGLLTEHALAHS